MTVTVTATDHTLVGPFYTAATNGPSVTCAAGTKTPGEAVAWADVDNDGACRLK